VRHRPIARQQGQRSHWTSARLPPLVSRWVQRSRSTVVETMMRRQQRNRPKASAIAGAGPTRVRLDDVRVEGCHPPLPVRGPDRIATAGPTCSARNTAGITSSFHHRSPERITRASQSLLGALPSRIIPKQRSHRRSMRPCSRVKGSVIMGPADARNESGVATVLGQEPRGEKSRAAPMRRVASQTVNDKALFGCVPSRARCFLRTSSAVLTDPSPTASGST